MFRWRRRGEGFILEDPKEVQEWVERNGGRPSRLAGTSIGEDPGLIRIWFPGQVVGRLEPVTWEAFLTKMQEKGLALRCWDADAGGRPFARIVSAPSSRSSRDSVMASIDSGWNR